MQAQEQVGQMMAEAMKAMPGMGGDTHAFEALSPDTAGLARAGQAMSDLWTAATGLSQTMSAALASAGREADFKLDPTLRTVADPRTWLASMGGMDGVLGKVAEGWAKGFGLPARTELDDVHRTVTELRRELRALKRRSRSAPAAVPPIPTTPGPAAPDLALSGPAAPEGE